MKRVVNKEKRARDKRVQELMEEEEKNAQKKRSKTDASVASTTATSPTATLTKTTTSTNKKRRSSKSNDDDEEYVDGAEEEEEEEVVLEPVETLDISLRRKTAEELRLLLLCAAEDGLDVRKLLSQGKKRLLNVHSQVAQLVQTEHQQKDQLKKALEQQVSSQQCLFVIRLSYICFSKGRSPTRAE